MHTRIMKCLFCVLLLIKLMVNCSARSVYLQFNRNTYSLDSPSTSLEAVGAPTAGQGTVPTPRQWVDSEDEAAGDLEADWSSNVDADVLQTLSKDEKKRQDIINGLL